MAPRPELYPLQTPKHIPYPSELQEHLRPAASEPTRCSDSKGPSVPPPVAYTEFLKALSPTFGSPPEYSYTAYPSASLKHYPCPSTASSTSSFPSDATKPASKSHKRSPSGPASPFDAPKSAVSISSSQVRHLRMSPYSPAGAVDSPKSAHPVRSPYAVSARARYATSPASATERSITIQQIVTHTVTLKRVPSLAPPPKGKRRRMPQARQEAAR